MERRIHYYFVINLYIFTNIEGLAGLLFSYLILRISMHRETQMSIAKFIFFLVSLTLIHNSHNA
jgi:hypothetical protein